MYYSKIFMKYLNVFSLTAIVLVFVFFNSCGKKNENPNPVSNSVYSGPKGTLRMHLHNYIGAVQIDEYNITYTTPENRKINVTKAQYYLSNFELVKSDGSIYTINDSIVCKVLDFETYEIADVPVGNYESINFYIGLNDQMNKKLPGTGNSALLNKPEMWFGSTPQPDGYIYFNFEGKIDITANGTGTTSEMQPFKYLLGTSKAFKKITMKEGKFTVSPDQVQFVHLNVDLSQIFKGIDLSKKENLNILNHSDNSSPAATKLIQNMSAMFKYEY